MAWAAFFNFIAFLFFGLNVANTIGTGVIDAGIVDVNVILGALIGAIAWNVITWWFGLPSSSSHALIGGLAGAAVAKGGVHALVGSGLFKISLAHRALAAAGVRARDAPHDGGRVDLLGHRADADRPLVPAPAARISASLYSLGHGGNDAQKTMGIIALILVAHGSLRPDFKGADIPFWVVLACQAAIALGTLFGGWRIVKTMGQKITKLKPVGGFCAETGGAMTLFLATALGIPVSTTHTITGAIIGVGATRKFSAVRWGVAGRIVWAWVLTIPCTALHRDDRVVARPPVFCEGPVPMRTVTFVRGVVARLTGVGLARTAAALSYATVLSLVPLFTVAFVYVARYPVFQQWLDALERFLLTHMLPGSASVVRSYLIEFSAKAAGLQGISIAFVVVTAVLLVATIEREINAIWGVREPRSWPRRVFVYALGVTAGPLLIGAAIYAMTWVLQTSVAQVPFVTPAVALIATPLAVAITTLAFTLLYALMPARRVPLEGRAVGRPVRRAGLRGREVRIPAIRHDGADLPGDLRNAGGRPAVPVLDLRLLVRGPRWRRGDGDTVRRRSARARVAPTLNHRGSRVSQAQWRRSAACRPAVPLRIGRGHATLRAVFTR